MKYVPRLWLVAWVVLGVPACDAFLSADQRVQRAEADIAAHDYRSAMIQLKNALQDQPDHVQARTRLAELEFRQGDVEAAEKDLRRALELGASNPANAELMAQIQLALGHGAQLLTQIESKELPLEGGALAFYRAQAELSVQRYEAAQRSFESVDANDPHATRARIGAAQALAAQGKSDLALQRLDELIHAQPGAASALLARGAIRARRGEFAAAEEDLTNARKQGATTLGIQQQANLLAALVEVQLARGAIDAAAASQRELARLAPSTVGVRVLAGRIAFARQDYALAAAELQRAVASDPESVAARFLLGVALFSQGNPRQAELQLSQVLQRAPEHLEARKLLAQINLILGRPETAMQVLLPTQNADDTRADMLRGLARIQQGDVSGGLKDLESAVAAHPNDETLQLDLATAYLKSERADLAVELLSKLGAPRNPLRRSTLLIAALQAAGETAKAQAEVEKLLRDRPRDLVALRLGAAFFAQQRNFARARGYAQSAVDIDPKNVNVLLMRGGIEADAGDVAAARTWFDKAAALDGGSSAAHMAIAELDARRGDLEAATRALEIVRKKDSQAVDARLHLAGLYMRQRKTAAAQAVIDELGVLGKDRPEVLNSLGLLFIQMGRYDDALLQFQSATAQDSANPMYWLNTARVQFALGNVAVAREALEKAVGAQPGWLPAVGTLALLDVKEGREASALQRVDELKANRPRDAAARVLEGDVYLASKNYVKAAAAYDAAAEIKPSNVIAIRAYRARLAGQLESPTRPLEKWLANHPADQGVRLVLAEAYQSSGDRRRAIAQYESMASSGARNAIALNNLAWLYLLENDARAEQTARQALALAPRSASIADTLGWILLERGKAAEALGLLKGAAATAPEPSIEYHLAVALARTGDKAEARKKLSEILARTPDFQEAAAARKLLDTLGEG